MAPLSYGVWTPDDTYCREDHVGEVDEGLCVEPSVDSQAHGRQEEQVAEAEEEGRGQEVDLGRGLAVVGAAPAFVAYGPRLGLCESAHIIKTFTGLVK